jgi:hypothetical protein
MELANQKIKEFDASKIHRFREFNEAMNYFDIQDDMTRNILLSVNEADQSSVMLALSNKLYKHVVDKVDDIDFGSIPASRGDITKIDNYEELVDCVNILTSLLAEYHQSVKPVETISLAVSNVRDRVDLFTKGYKLNVEMPIVAYNTIVLSIVAGVSYMISSCIEFVKLPGEEGFEIAMDKAAAMKTSSALLYADLEKFNNMCAKGEFDKAMDFVIAQHAKGFTGLDFGLAASGIVLSLGLILLIIPMLRELIFIFYYARESVSVYCDNMATLLQMNAYNLESKMARTPKDKKEVAARQRKVADVFKKISTKIKVNLDTAESKAAKEIKALDAKKYKHDEVLDSVPDSSNSVLF